MPQHRSAIKRIRSDAKRRLQNRMVKTKVKTVTRRLEAAADPETARQLLPEAYRAIDRASKKGVLQKRTAARRKARLARQLTKAAKSS